MRCAAVAVVVLALAQLAGAAERADGFEYKEPAGWTRVKLPDGSVAFQPPTVPAGKGCSVMFLQPAEGELAAHFDQTWKRTAGAVRVESGGKIVSGKTSGGVETRSVTAVVEGGGQKTWMHFVAFQTGPRVQMVLYSANDGELFDEHLPAADAMLDSIHLAGAPAPAPARPAVKNAPAKQDAPPKGKGPGFDGVFYAAKVSFDAAGAPGARATRVDYLCFSSDGLVYSGTPTGGPVSVFESVDDSPNYGRYTLDGDTFKIAWNYDKLTKQRRTDAGKRLPSGKVELNGNTYHAIPPCDGMTLEGTYSWKWGGGESVIRFTRDGRFTERGLRETVSDDKLVHPDWPKMPERGSGTYSIRRNTLEVAYDNGPTRRIFFVTRDDPKDVRSISINTYPHEKAP
jgi:hypothetical protein